MQGLDNPGRGYEIGIGDQYFLPGTVYQLQVGLLDIGFPVAGTVLEEPCPGRLEVQRQFLRSQLPNALFQPRIGIEMKFDLPGFLQHLAGRRLVFRMPRLFFTSTK